MKYGSVRESTESQITQDNQISHFNKTFYYNLGEGEGVGEKIREGGGRGEMNEIRHQFGGR